MVLEMTPINPLVNKLMIMDSDQEKIIIDVIWMLKEDIDENLGFEDLV
jgi:hypothetical protein